MKLGGSSEIRTSATSPCMSICVTPFTRQRMLSKQLLGAPNHMATAWRLLLSLTSQQVMWTQGHAVTTSPLPGKQEGCRRQCSQERHQAPRWPAALALGVAQRPGCGRLLPAAIGRALSMGKPWHFVPVAYLGDPRSCRRRCHAPPRACADPTAAMNTKKDALKM